MELYDESELQNSIEAGERRLAAAKQRKRRGRQMMIASACALAIAIPVLIAAGIASGRAPEAPNLIVTWPKPKVRQVVPSGQTVLFRSGQPFQLSVTDPDRWDVTWKLGSIETRGVESNWAPSEATGKVVALCRPIVSDWTSTFAFLWPTREVTLNSVVAPRLGNYGQQLETGKDGVWLFPHIFAVGKVSWDERALPKLYEAAPAIPENELAEANLTPPKAIWRIVSDFDGQSKTPSLNGTFASLQSKNLEEEMPQIAAKLVKSLPDASIKFILRLDKDPAEGILRLDFDEKKERKAWKRSKGQASGAPLTGWETGEIGADSVTNLLPSLPQ
jgi:hypothetical protein